MNFKERNSMQSKASQIIKQAVMDGTDFEMNKKESFYGTTLAFQLDDDYYVSSLSYMKRSIPPLCSHFWKLVESCDKDRFDDWEGRAIAQYQGHKRPLREEVTSNVRNKKTRQASNEVVSDPDDRYGHDAKLLQRIGFITMCMTYEGKAGEANAILYLETESCNMTALLLQSFGARQLHPCNRDARKVHAIHTKHPDVNARLGRIEDLHSEQQWLGVWYDMEETWCEKYEPGQPWKLDQIPNFKQAIVNAVTLSAHAMIGGAEQHAIELQKLIESKGGHTPSLASACDGRSGKMTMVFGIGIFERDVLPGAEDYLFCHLKVPRSQFRGNRWYKKFDWSSYAIDDEDHLYATVVGVKKDRLSVRFMNKSGFMFTNDDDWEPGVKDIACMRVCPVVA